MSIISKLAFREGRITGVNLTPGPGGIETSIKIHAPVDAETTESIGAGDEDPEKIESCKLRFRMLDATVKFTGAGNLSKFTASMGSCEASAFVLKPTGDLGDGNPKAKKVHVTFTLSTGSPSGEITDFLGKVGQAPLLISIKGNLAPQQQALDLDASGAEGTAEAAVAAAKGADSGGELKKISALYARLTETMREAKVAFPQGTQPLGAAGKTDFARIAKRARESSEELGEKVDRIVAEIIILRDQMKGR